VYIVSIVWSFACVLTDIVCVSSLLSFGQVVSRIVSRPLNLSVVFVHGGTIVEIFSHLRSCCVASLSRDVVLCAFVLGLSFVGIGGGNGWWGVIAPFVRESLDYWG
jgi:hypothetical protein